MPMAINSPEEYEKVINVSWFIHDQSAENITYVHISSELGGPNNVVTPAYCRSRRCTLCAALTFETS